MTPNEYQQAALRTEAPTVHGTNMPKPRHERLSEGIIGLSGESGECIDILKKHLYQGHKLDDHDLALELGDVAWYLALSADAIGYSLEEIFRMNLDKLEERYPSGFEPDRSINR